MLSLTLTIPPLYMCVYSASSASLLLVLSHLYKDYVYVPIFFMLLDVFGHWVHMYATLLSGGKFE